MNSYTLMAHKIALDAGRTIRAIFSRVGKLSPEQRADHSIFMQFFKQVEQELQNGIFEAYPDHSIYTKHLEPLVHQERHKWYVSGITSEENFRTGDEHFSISIAYEVDDKLMSAVVYNPITDDTYQASRNEGAIFNGKKIHSYKISGSLNESALLVALCRDSDYLEKINQLYRSSRSIRILGDVALDICLVAQGVYNGFCAAECNEFDFSAAHLIAQESGILVTNFRGIEDYQAGNIVVSHPRLLKALLKSLQ